jgi:hypothetical protein
MVCMKVKDCVFIHIPKTAGSSITQWIKENTSYREYFEYPVHAKLSNIKDSYEFSFCVVRNPWDRVVSLWAFWNEVKNTHVSFDTFVYNLNTYKFSEDFTFDQPQKEWIPDGVTHLLKFETIVQDFVQIQDLFGSSVPLLNINASEHTEYHTYYTQETWDIVATIFKHDIEAFGYGDDSLLKY